MELRKNMLDVFLHKMPFLLFINLDGSPLLSVCKKLNISYSYGQKVLIIFRKLGYVRGRVLTKKGVELKINMVKLKNMFGKLKGKV